MLLWFGWLLGLAQAAALTVLLRGYEDRLFRTDLVSQRAGAAEEDIGGTQIGVPGTRRARAGVVCCILWDTITEIKTG